jgi:sugar fermentation stimulation protein A
MRYSDSTLLASVSHAGYIFLYGPQLSRKAMKLPTPLLTGTLIKCYRRSLVDVRLGDGNVVKAYRPNSGKMRGCSEPGRPVVLSDSGNPARRHRLTWELIDMNDTWIGVNPSIPIKVIYDALKLKLIPPLALYDEGRPERDLWSQ